MSDKVSLSKTQVRFVVEMTEIINPEEAVDRFIEILIEERVDPSSISIVIDKLMRRMDFR